MKQKAHKDENRTKCNLEKITINKLLAFLFISLSFLIALTSA